MDIHTLTQHQRIIGLAISGLCTLLFMALSIAFVPTLLVKPAPFALCFTLGNISAIACTFFVAGPRKQIKSMSDPKHLISTIIYLAALVLTLVSAIFVCFSPCSLFQQRFFFAHTHSKPTTQLKIWLVTLLAVILQLGALLWYILSFIPGAQSWVRGQVTDQLPL